MTLQAVVFDFDGTILDSESAIHDAWRHAFRSHGATFTAAEWASIIGSTTTVGGFDPEAALVERATQPVDLDAVRAHVRDAQRAGVSREPLPGVRRLVADLRAAGVRLGIATSASRWWVDHHLPRVGLDEHFSAWSGRDDVGGTPKPDPGVYLRTLALLEVDACHAVAIEDTPHGVAAAKAAGLRVLAVPNPLVDAHGTGADAVAASLEAVTVDDLAALLG